MSGLTFTRHQDTRHQLIESPLSIDNDRELYYRLIQPDNSSSVINAARDYLARALEETASQQDLATSFRFSGDSTSLSHDIDVFRQSLQTNVGRNAHSLQGLIRQYAPMGLLGMGWLQSVSHAAQAHTPAAALLFRLYSRSLGFQQGSQHRMNHFRDVLAHYEIALPDPATWLFSNYPGFVDEAFRLPVIGLCMSRVPETYKPELLGFTVAHCCDLSRLTHFIHPESNERSDQPVCLRKFLKCLDNVLDRALILNAVETCLQSVSDNELEFFRQRLVNGVWLYVHAESGIVDVVTKQGREIQKHWDEVVNEDAVCQTITDLSMSGNSRNAGELTLYGKPLRNWFKDEPVLADKYLKSWIDSKQASHHHAAMRRYFSDSSIFTEDSDNKTSSHHSIKSLVSRYQALKNRHSWLMDDNDTVTEQHPGSLKQAEINARVDIGIGADGQHYDSRRLYHELLNLESHPQCLSPACRFVEQQLKQSHRALKRIKPEHLRVIEYSQPALEHLIDTIHQAEASRKKPFTAPPKLSKQAYLWGIQQFAPVLLVDGSWLQNSAMAGNHHHVVSRYQFRIYADEIGDGHCDWNHANVYRDLLNKTAIELPEFTSKEFSQHKAFVKGAFDLPVFFLAISQFPSRFQPEIIGLNLAIELSGLGSTYQRLVDEMEYWKLDSTIVSLHLSIDNLTSGHAALAQDAVVAYLDQILNQHGYAEMQHHWQRIWSGYLALQTVPKRFKRALIMSYVFRFVLKTDQLLKINR
ncbi:MAG: iron-containing redox enzyme family protein [Gammaproteobacteria bacterium]|nr:iron-containing redox enzyme family protein [Gammaproteobacteria bacterium]